jgi:acyl-CoA reductase-like NAD-dependent aldehyde dehydrogenase
MTAINTIAPALMAGNTVVLKHASQTLLVGERLVQAFIEAGVPEDVFQNVFLDHETTSALIAAGSFNFVNFTGSVEGGRSMERAAAGTFTGLGLELGGKDPGYVMEDADLEAAVDTLMDGATYNSGQCCCGIERIYVHESLYDAFVEKSVAWVSNYKLGNPLDADTTLGPMAHKRFAATVRSQIRDAVAKGAQTLVDPKRFPYAQMSDGILTAGEPNLELAKKLGLGERRMPGDGTLPLREIFAALPSGLPISVEVIMDRPPEISPLMWATIALHRTRDFLKTSSTADA